MSKFLKLENLNGIEVLENLEKLSIFRARNLSDILALQTLKKLQKLKLDGCPHVTDLKIFEESSVKIEIL